MKFQFDLKEALFVIGLGLSVVATFILYIGYQLLASETFAVIIGVAFLIYYLIIGSIGGILMLLGKSPNLKLNYILIPVFFAQLILVVLTLSLPVEISPSSYILFAPPILVALRIGVWATKKMDVRRVEKYKFFRKIEKIR